MGLVSDGDLDDTVAMGTTTMCCFIYRLTVMIKSIQWRPLTPHLLWWGPSESRGVCGLWTHVVVDPTSARLLNDDWLLIVDGLNGD